MVHTGMFMREQSQEMNHAKYDASSIGGDGRCCVPFTREKVGGKHRNPEVAPTTPIAIILGVIQRV